MEVKKKLFCYLCPKCDTMVEKFELYCPCCGTQLEWSD